MVLHEKHELMGIAVYQSPTYPRRCVIRAKGPRTTFEAGLKALRVACPGAYPSNRS